MWKFKFGAWAVMLMMTALSFSACSDDDDDPALVPPSNITEALKQLYPAAQNIEWEMKGDYYVADCWVTGDELDVWFDANANWVMTENELDSIDQLVPAAYTHCGEGGGKYFHYEPVCRFHPGIPLYNLYGIPDR